MLSGPCCGFAFMNCSLAFMDPQKLAGGGSVLVAITLISWIPKHVRADRRRPGSSCWQSTAAVAPQA